MIKKSQSIHLQDFPNLDFIKDDKHLVSKMDLVRLVCNAALSIRDNKNLRVRLPLNNLTIIGKNNIDLGDFTDIIADEVNVKSVSFQNSFEEVAELKLAINFKKIGATMGPKIKEIMVASKKGDWKKISEDEISIAGTALKGDDFSLKLTPKKHDNKKIAIQALSDNSHLISLDLNITDDLKQEGIARDIIRLIQQARKDANLDVSDKINLNIASEQPMIAGILKKFYDYIKEQVLANKIELVSEEGLDNTNSFISSGRTDDADIKIAIIK